MELKKLLDVGVELGYRLAFCGAETFRVEESVSRVMAAYGVECETFAVPNSLIVTLTNEDGETMTRLKRIGYHGTNIMGIERYNAICRKLCAETPDVDEARVMLDEERHKVVGYPLWLIFPAYIVASGAFSFLFGAGWLEALCAGICGLACGITLEFQSWLHVNDFFKVMVAAFVVTACAQTAAFFGIIPNADSTTIGAIMLLVPGMMFTNSMRDIIFGDTISGTNRLVQVFISALALGIGTGSALLFCRLFYQKADIAIVTDASPEILQYVGAFVACLGFCLLFNAHGKGMIFCALGGMLGWIVYLAFQKLGAGDFIANFASAVAITTYSEIMARIRKFPATSYLLISLLPLVPGAGVYYSVEYLLDSNKEAFSSRLILTGSAACALAVGVLFVSSIFRMLSTWSNYGKSGNRFWSR